MSTTDHIPDAGKMPTEQDYTRDLAADLAIQQAATKGPWTLRADKYDDWGTIRAADGMPVASAMMYARTNEEEMEKARREKTSPKEIEANGLAITNAGTHAQCWIRRAQAAEAAILAMDSAVAEPTKWGVSDAITAIQAIAARIRAGREKGAQP